MKRHLTLAAATTLALGCASSQALAATATTALDVYSAYVWRGITVNKGFVLQPSVDVSANGFAVNVWANYDLDDYSGNVEKNRVSEVDLTGTYTFKLGPLDANVGLIEYTFPHTKPANKPNGTDIPSTTEVFAGLGYDLGHGFSVNTKVYYDFVEVDDFYATAGLGYSYNLNEKTTLGLNGLISYAGSNFSEHYGGGTRAGFFNYQLTASMKYAITEAFAVSANINYTDSMDKSVLTDTVLDTKVFGGISLTYTF